MTRNQIDYLKHVENQRNNRAVEQLTKTRDTNNYQLGLSTLAETTRAHKASERLQAGANAEMARHNLASEVELNRHQTAVEHEQNRTNVANEGIKRTQNASLNELNYARAEQVRLDTSTARLTKPADVAGRYVDVVNSGLNAATKVISLGAPLLGG